MSRGRPWTPREIATLRRYYATLGPRPIARKLNRSRDSVFHRARKCGLLTHRWWTADELEVLRKEYGKAPARDIASALSKSIRGVYQAAANLGLTRPYKRPCDQPGFEQLLRARHAAGYSDAEIAAEIGTDRHIIGKRRKALGLADNTLSERRRRRVAAKTREQCARAGLPSLAAVRVKTFRDRARAEGWPEDLRPRAVQILSTLWDRGPMTRREIADAVGMPWLGTRKSLRSNDPEGSYLAHLMKRGLVVCIKRACRGVGRGHSTNIYSLPPLTTRRYS